MHLVLNFDLYGLVFLKLEVIPLSGYIFYEYHIIDLDLFSIVGWKGYCWAWTIRMNSKQIIMDICKGVIQKEAT
jgi:hypothetical protein